jgi:hypothetical protein
MRQRGGEFWASASSLLGLLIHAAVGSAGGLGGRRTKRSGVAAYAAARTSVRAAWVCSAWPWWTVAGVISPIPEWRWAWLYQAKNSRQNARACSIVSNLAGNPGRYFRVLKCASE